MAVTHSTAAKNAAADAIVDLVDAGSGAGYIEILDGATLLATLVCSDPAFGAAAAGVATADTITDEASADDTGTADVWKLYDSDDTLIVSGTVGQKRAITGTVVDGAGGSVQVSGDHTGEFAAGTDFTIVGSSSNDGSYTVASVSESGGTTTIVIEADQTLADTTADGDVHVGEIGMDNTSIAVTQTVSLSSFTYAALRQ